MMVQGGTFWVQPGDNLDDAVIIGCTVIIPSTTPLMTPEDFNEAFVKIAVSVENAVFKNCMILSTVSTASIEAQKALDKAMQRPAE